MDKIFAIDLGTANCRSAITENGNAEIVKDAEGKTAMPSAVAVSEQGKYFTGSAALGIKTKYPERAVLSVVRSLGSTEKITMGGESFTAQELAAWLLLRMKWNTQAYTGEKLREAVIAVPARLSPAARRAAAQAARIADLDLKGMIDEPSAAAISWWNRHRKDQKILVYSQGAGFLDVTVFEITGRKMTILASESDKIGGNDFDDCIVRYMVSDFKNENGVDLSTDSAAMERLRQAAVRAREEMSSPMKHSSDIYLPFITTTASGMLHFEMNLRRETVERLTRDLTYRCETHVRTVLKAADLSGSDLFAVVMAGGCTHMSAISSMLLRATGQDPEKDSDIDQGIVLGAACCAAGLSSDIYMSDFPEPALMEASSGTEDDSDTGLTKQEITALISKAETLENENKELAEALRRGGLRAASGSQGKSGSGSPASASAGSDRRWSGHASAAGTGNRSSGYTSAAGTAANGQESRNSDGTDENTVRTVVRQFLPVVDNLERALKAAEGREDDPFVAGIEKTYRQMMNILKSMGVEPIQAVGKKFDPKFHCAVQHVDEAGVDDGIIIAEFQKGYTCHGMVIRFSMVVVAN